MFSFFFRHGYDLLYVAAGLAIGAMVSALRVRRRLKAFHAQQLADAGERLTDLEAQLKTAQQAESDQRGQSAQLREEIRRNHLQMAEFGKVTATLETRLEALPGLTADLAQARAAAAKLQDDLRGETAALAQALERNAQLAKVETDRDRKAERIEALNRQLAQLGAEFAELKTVIAMEREQAAEKIALLNQARDQLKSEFQNLAQRIFEEKSSVFIDQNRSHLDQVIGPLREQLGDFKKRVEDVYDKEARDRTALHSEINHLKELNQRIGKEALNLTRALKGDSKIRGNWGEVILERVLEASGLQKGREYDVQVNLRDGRGKRYQPDVIVHLPEGRQVIVDAKVSLTDYETYYAAEDTRAREAALGAHIESLRTHLRSLAAKRYADLEGVQSLDFVLMFIPIEAAFLAAVEKDRDLFSEAFEQNIVMVSPTTLLVTLRTIQNIWRYEYQNRNALEIAKKAGRLYDKFVGFVEALQDIGKQLDRAVEAYRTAHERLISGRGNLVNRAQELKALGVKAGKALSAETIAWAQDETAEDEG